MSNLVYNKKEIFKSFNTKYFDLLNFMKTHSNQNKEFNYFYKKNYILKKTNIKMFIKTWHENITQKYYEPIMNDNINYFLNKDYTNEMNKINSLNSSVQENKLIENMKKLYYDMDEKITSEFIVYIKHLTFLTYLYNKTE